MTSLIRERPPLGTYSKSTPRALWWFWGGKVRATPVLRQALKAENEAVFSSDTIYSLMSLKKGQLPRKTVNFIFQLVMVNNKLTILWGGVTF